MRTTVEPGVAALAPGTHPADPTSLGPAGRPAALMTSDEAAWIRENAWTQAMRKTDREVPGYLHTCACQYGPTSACQHGQCDSCHRGTPQPGPAGYVCGGPGGQTVLGFGVPYKHPTRSATGRHKTDAAMFWLADRVCRWRCTHECHNRTRGEQAALFALAASA